MSSKLFLWPTSLTIRVSLERRNLKRFFFFYRVRNKWLLCSLMSVDILTFIFKALEKNHVWFIKKRLIEKKNPMNICQGSWDLNPRPTVHYRWSFAPQVAAQARKLLTICNNSPTDEHTLDYDEHNPFQLCARSYKPIYHGREFEACTYCGASYTPQYKDDLCTVCTVSVVDKSRSVYGLQICKK